MNEFKLCENGHHFPQNLKECPYCPKANSLDQDPLFSPGGGGNLDKTIINPQIMAGSLDNPSFFESSNMGGGGSLSRTQIYGGGGASDAFLPSTPSFPSTPQSSGRKLVGWLVSFTIDPNGADFKLYEGRNLIGSDPGCDIVIPYDAAVSGRHLTVLYRMGQFKFKDELSTNGTFINDVFEEEGNLKDGDIIKMGDTIFKFRSIA